MMVRLVAVQRRTSSSGGAKINHHITQKNVAPPPITIAIAIHQTISMTNPPAGRLGCAGGRSLGSGCPVLGLSQPNLFRATGFDTDRPLKANGCTAEIPHGAAFKIT